MAHALNSFGQYCRKIRIARDVTMGDQAAALGVSVATISEVECGLRLPPSGYVDHFSRWLGLTPQTKHDLEVRLPKAKIIEFPKPATNSRSVRLFRKVSKWSPDEIRAVKAKEVLND